MLYDRWREIARQFRNDVALRDLSTGMRWTFGELAAAVERQPSATDTVVFPQGQTSDLVFSVLQGWRAARVICPLESGQSFPQFETLPAGCCHLKVTSATSGSAKVIGFRAEQLIADAENIVATMGLRQEWPNLGVISLAHSYGFSNLILPLLLHGIPLVLAPSPLPEPVNLALAEMEAATLPGVPALWRAWADAGIIDGKVRLAISAGSPLPLLLETSVFCNTGIKIHNFYGSSECGGIAYDSGNELRASTDCVGKAMKNVALSINVDGCLEVRSRAVGETYWPAPTGDLAKGCFRTSDLAEINDGNVFLRGRAGDQINVAGRKVTPDAIERALLLNPDVVACVVFGVPSRDAERSDTIVAGVVTKGAVSPESLKQFLLQHLPAWQVPREWWKVDSIAANHRGKLSRAEWRQKFLVSRG